MAVDLLAKRDIPEELCPTTPGTMTVVTSGVSGAWTATPVQLHAGLSFDFVLCGMYAHERYALSTQGTQAALTGYQIGTGTAGAETWIAEGSGCLLLSPGGVAQTVIGITARTIFFMPAVIPASTRIAVRSTNNTTVAHVCAPVLFGYKATDVPLAVMQALHFQRDRLYHGLCGTQMASRVWPTGATTAVTGGATANTYGTWVQFLNRSVTPGNPLLITGLVGGEIVSALKAHAEIGVGASATYVTMGRVALPGAAGMPGPLGDCYLPRPIYVKPGEDVAVRIATSTASQVVDIALRGYELL